MLEMILKMSAVTAGHVVLTVILWSALRGKTLKVSHKILIAMIYGLCAVLSTHFGIDYSDMMINVRDLGPLIAGLFFDPVSGIVAGLIGGIERYIAGTYWGIGSYTRIACSISTCLSGFLAAFLHLVIFKKKKPSPFYAFFIGAVMEVFHMYVVFITHRNDMQMAFYVVRICAAPMIIFTGIGLSAAAVVLIVRSGEWVNPFRKVSSEQVKVSEKFQFWLFVVTSVLVVLNFFGSFMLQTNAALQNARNTLTSVSQDIQASYSNVLKSSAGMKLLSFHVGETGSFEFVDVSGRIVYGDHQGEILPQEINEILHDQEDGGFVTAEVFGEPALCRVGTLDGARILLVQAPLAEVYASRDAQAYETVFGYIILFTVIYILISMLVQRIVVRNLEMVNTSLQKITNGDLNEKVDVYTSSEFTSLSNDINQTVYVLKGYIEAAEKRIEQELEFAKNIQESALPHNFKFPRTDFEIFASMDPAREVGGDFYDFFFVGHDKIVLVIADVSGKGIPASLFMMRSKTAIRSAAESGGMPAEVFEKTNNMLCEGNDAEMFVTVWMGILDLNTGHMICANAGHEYPVLMRKDGDFELYRQKHSPALATIEGIPFKEYELDLYPGDCLFVYTDGIPEAINEQVEDYGTDRLVEVLNAHKYDALEDLLPTVRRDIEDFVGEADQFDDVTMLGFRYKPLEIQEDYEDTTDWK